VKNKLQKNKNYFLLLIVFFFLILPFGAMATTLKLEPSLSEHKIKDSFILDVQINTKSECINAVGINLKFPQQILEAVDFSKGSSILQIWPQEPRLNNQEGTVSFSGGVPGGYCTENQFESLGEIVFKTKEVSKKIVEKVIFLEAEAFLDDGKATLDETVTESGYFIIIPDYSIEKLDPWERRLKEDRTPPEAFSLRISKDSLLYDNQKTLFFSTVDHQTGVDYYQVLEKKRIGFIKMGSEEWEKAKSPYLLKDQSLNSVIKVKAVDKAGNERVEEFNPGYSWQDVGPWLLLILIIGVNVWKQKNDDDHNLKVEWI
jgi:hypothetical protein